MGKRMTKKDRKVVAKAKRKAKVRSLKEYERYKEITTRRYWLPDFEVKSNVRLVRKYRPAVDVEDIIAMEQAELARQHEILHRSFGYI